MVLRRGAVRPYACQIFNNLRYVFKAVLCRPMSVGGTFNNSELPADLH